MKGIRGLLPLLALLAAWQLMGDAKSIALPPPAEWFRSLAELHADGVVLAALTETLSTYLLGLAVAVVAGALTGAAIGSSRHVDRALTPSLDFIARGARRVKGVKLVDPRKVLCPDRRCPSVIGNVIVYRDTYHLSATFAKTLAPWLYERLPDLT